MSNKLVSMSKLLSDTCIPFFKEIGFQKKKEGIFYKRYGSNLYLRIGLNESDKCKDIIVINPMFGVGWEDLESLLSRCEKEKYSPFLFPSFSSNIGGFLENNEVIKFTFNRDTIVDEVNDFRTFIKRVADLTEVKYSNHTDLLEGLIRYKNIQQNTERLACYYQLIGDKKTALKTIEKEREKLKTSHPVMQKQFDEFYECFIQEIT